ncbi:MAG: acetylglutamate kinase [Bacteroidaceae bacterium]|nr:acetylglutamate kinase [Prevotellaceae bacterium]MDY5631221.1 acetylglutamate kinase [Bacteroidaceae bacterium]
MEQLTVIKVGGAVVEQPEFLNELISNFAAVPGHKILVHGGGRSATRIASDLGIESQMVEGRRVTDEKMLNVVTMVYGGLVNKNIVALMQARGLNAAGFTGADMNLIRAHKRPVKDVDYGWVGDLDNVDGELLSTLIQRGIVPVMAPLSHDGQGHLLNTNADTIASAVALALVPYFDVTLTFAFEKNGVLLDAEDDDSVIPHLDAGLYARLKADGCITDGMLPKLDNAFASLQKGVKKVLITSAVDLLGHSGTIIE